MNEKIKVGILGATGSVGQKFIELLNNHPWFEIAEVAASDKSAGKKYSEAVNWIQSAPIQERVSEMKIKKCDTNLESKILFSALDSGVAGEIEKELSKAGFLIISNSKNHRFDMNVPLIVPEVNPNHLSLIESQSTKGAIVTNPNCSTIGLVLALKPLIDVFGIDCFNVVTMQALSGAGYPGVSSLDIIDNIIPFISGEEEKLEKEPLKIFGEFNQNQIEPAKIKISASCNRVAVIDGHTEVVQINLKNKATKDEIIEVWKKFKSIPGTMNLPSAPLNPIYYFEDEKYPQPKLHRNIDKGMAVSIGRLRKCNLFDYKFVIMSHNTIRGAAGGTILIAELMKAQNILEKYL